MSLKDFNSEDSEDREGKESETYWDGVHRPIIDEEKHNRVDVFATRQNIDNVDAYELIIERLLTEDGKLKPQAKSLFAYES